MQKTFFLFLSFLFLISCNLVFSNLIYTYNEFTNGKKTTTTWEIDEDDKNLELIGKDNTSITTLKCSKDFEISKFTYKSKIDPTEYVFSINKNVLIAKGKVNNKTLSKQYSINSPWIQQFGFGLKSFILSKHSSLRFYLINPEDFSIQKMIASKERIESITINEKTYQTQKINVTLQGFKSMFWKAKLWFDSKTGDLLKYVANKGPNTPTTTMLLNSIKKEGIFNELKNSFLKEKNDKEEKK